MRHINAGPLAIQKHFVASRDAEWDSVEVDEDALLDYLEPMSGGVAPDPLEEDPEGCAQARDVPLDCDTRGGLVLDWHTCDAWPERWVDLVVVLRCNHELIWKRLEKRHYSEKKIAENNEAEIMGVVEDEARSAYPQEAIIVLPSETSDQLESHVERIVAWIRAWRQQRGLES